MVSVICRSKILEKKCWSAFFDKKCWSAQHGAVPLFRESPNNTCSPSDILTFPLLPHWLEAALHWLGAAPSGAQEPLEEAARTGQSGQREEGKQNWWQEKLWVNVISGQLAPHLKYKVWTSIRKKCTGMSQRVHRWSIGCTERSARQEWQVSAFWELFADCLKVAWV